jgi:hypothetical protein
MLVPRNKAFLTAERVLSAIKAGHSPLPPPTGAIVEETSHRYLSLKKQVQKLWETSFKLNDK